MIKYRSNSEDTTVPVPLSSRRLKKKEKNRLTVHSVRVVVRLGLDSSRLGLAWSYPMGADLLAAPVYRLLALTCLSHSGPISRPRSPPIQANHVYI